MGWVITDSRRLGRKGRAKLEAVNTLGVVIVSYGHEADVEKLVHSFLPQLKGGDRVVIVDNKKPWRFAQTVLFDDDRIQVVEHDNGGFAAGCNVGAARLDTDIIFFLNPDTQIKDPNLFDSMRAMGDSDYAAWMPYLLLGDSGKVNSAGNALHISGLSWVNGLDTSPDFEAGVSRISAASGACLAVKRSWFNEIGGMSEEYFMYHEDLDFCARLQLAGGSIALVHEAFVNHNYDYGKGDYKWIYIERNRLMFALATWPALVLAVLAPQLLGVGVGLWAIAAKQHRLGLKVRSATLLIKAIPQIRRMRARAARTRRLSAPEFYSLMSWQLDNPNLGLQDAVLVQKIYRAYYQLGAVILKLVK